MAAELARCFFILWLLPFLTFYLVKADSFLFYKGLLPAAPSVLFVCGSFPLLYSVWLASLSNNRFVLLLHGCRAILLPFWFIVMSGLLGILVRAGEFPPDLKLLFLSALDFYVFLIGLVIGALTQDRRLWTLIPLLGLAITVITIAFDVTHPYTFTQPDLVGPAGFSQNPNTGALTALLLLTATLDWQSRDISLFDGIVLVLALLAIFLTASRSGILLTTVVTLLYLYRGRTAFIRLKTFGKFAVLVVGVTFWLGSSSGSEIVSRMQTFILNSSKLSDFFDARSSTRTFTDDATMARVGAARESFNLIAEAPLFGIGTGFVYNMAVGPHNKYLAFWVENGIIGLFFYLWFLFALAWLNHKNKDPKAVVLTLIMVLAGLFSHNLLEDRTLLLLLAIFTAHGVLASDSHNAVSPERSVSL